MVREASSRLELQQNKKKQQNHRLIAAEQAEHTRTSRLFFAWWEQLSVHDLKVEHDFIKGGPSDFIPHKCTL